MDLRGTVNKIEWDGWKTGEKVPTKVMIDVVYAKLDIAGRNIYEVDVENNIRIVDGEDKLAAIRAAIGL